MGSAPSVQNLSQNQILDECTVIWSAAQFNLEVQKSHFAGNLNVRLLSFVWLSLITTQLNRF